ncbi:MAG: branched-chain-amino-acid transaminase [Endomicrobiaceae bacterium]|jgi:branched-chain amino acid aminotransferase|nr:branched-chain-amino-acid transaminase [Endomicrobiaceae bacterium]MDD4166309.1 branched-chain-amino-acid transaminase [Endomicrobiaceae bacterium]
MKIYLNGKFVNKEDAVVSVFDHGLLYGDGVFEGIRAYNGRVFRLAEHIDRLWDSAKAIALCIPMTKSEMEKIVLETLKINKLDDAYIRLVISRGTGDLGLDPAKCPKPTIFVITDKISLYPDELYTNGLEVITVSTRRTTPDTLSPNIKSLNYLNNIMAKLEAKRAGVLEAIMLNREGYVAECSGDNIFVVKNGVVTTPPAYAGALKGVTRNTAIELIRNKLKIEIKEDMLTVYDLYCADECYLTGTAAEIIPVVKVDGRIIGDGKPGKITAKLLKEFRNLTRTTGVPINK